MALTTLVPDESEPAPLLETPLAALHVELGARMVPFAGYMMPVQYPAGIVAEHTQCRTAAALFDVSHMGQALLTGDGAARALERLVPSDIMGLKPGRQRYTLLLNEAGGIEDDLMVATIAPEKLFLVVNASRKDHDFELIASVLPDGVTLTPAPELALVALQGPAAIAVMARLAPAAAALGFMGVTHVSLAGVECLVSRSGYSGEDGFEISAPAAGIEVVARLLLAQTEVAPAGLGARDSLRLEAGLCLYGQDIDALTSPVEAGLSWTLSKRRRTDWDFPGAAAIRDHYENGPVRMRVGVRPDGRAPARAGCEMVATDGTAAGSITSGSFSPTLGAPIAMGYVRRDLAAIGTEVELMVRGKRLPARVAELPFVAHRYIR